MKAEKYWSVAWFKADVMNVTSFCQRNEEKKTIEKG